MYFSQKYSSYGDWKRPIKAFDQLYEDFCSKCIRFALITVREFNM